MATSIPDQNLTSGVSRPAVQPESLYQLFETQAAVGPDRVAIECEAAKITYRTAAARAGVLATGLASLGAGPGKIVACCLPRSPESLVLLLAIARTGGTWLALDPGYPDDQLRMRLENADANLLITESAGRGEALGFAGKTLTLDDLAEVGKADRRTGVPGQSANAPYIVYTSGSTGQPKAIMQSRQGVLNYERWITGKTALNAGDRVIQLASLAVDAFARELFVPLSAGATIVVPEARDQKDPAAIFRTIERTGITAMLSVVPSLIRAMHAASSGTQRSRGTVRLFLTVGEPLHGSDLHGIRDLLGSQARVFNQYGVSEVAMAALVHECDTSRDSESRVALGTLVPGVEAHVLEPDILSEISGFQGELCLAGEAVSAGYHHDPALTAARFVPNPTPESGGGRLYRTGDLVHRNSDGHFHFRGRIDRQVKVSGIRIEPGEVEAVLAGHAAVGAVAVGVRDLENNVRQLVAHVVLNLGPKATAASLRRFCAARLPAYAVPALFHVLEELPVLPGGKTDYRSLAQALEDDCRRSVSQKRDRNTAVGFRFLANALHPDQPFYGLEARGLQAGQTPSSGVARMAGRYLDAIREVQPTGPYFIGGRCFGGLIALEMAHTLCEAGQHVAMLAILDTQMLCNVEVSTSESTPVPGNGTTLATSQQANGRGGWGRQGKITNPVFVRMRNVARKHEKARKKYAPKPYPGKITLFRNGDATPIPAYHSQWESLALGGLDSHLVEGQHTNIMREPHVRGLAKKLQAALDVAAMNANADASQIAVS